VNPLVYWIVRGILQPFFHVWFRLERIGREHIPARGPVILASNHRSFLDPFVIAVMTPRPIYFVAKKELFLFHPVVSWLLGALGAFPIDRGASDQEAMATARAILDRGEAVLMFPEGTRIRPGSLGRPKRGVGRLALETGAPVVPVAVIGTEAVRRGLRIRPHKVRIRAGRALTFPRVERPSPALAGAVTDRIWPCVELQWEWLGGLPRLRRAAVIGAGETGTALAVAFARAGLEVDLATRTVADANRIGAAGRNDGALPGVPFPDGVAVVPAAELELQHHDLVAFALAPRRVGPALAAHGERIPGRAGVLVAGAGQAPAEAAQLVDRVARSVRGRAVAYLAVPEDAGALVGGAAVAVASADAPFLAQLAAALRAGGLDVSRCPDAAAAARATVPTTSPRRSRAA
jgi:1-acyl-sn-glycerol-3-phosphate acyltransferase